MTNEFNSTGSELNRKIASEERRVPLLEREQTDPHEEEFVPSEYLADLKRDVESILDRCLRFSSDCPRRLQDAMRYSVLAPGKRLRPILALIAADLCGGEREQAYSACVALEATHVYSLIHDDLPAMDDDDLRRGLPTCHCKFDEATAILAGDALLTYAFEALTSQISDPTVASRCVLALAQAAGACGMVGGQTDDVLWGEEVRAPSCVIDEYRSLVSIASGETDDEPVERLSLLGDFLKKIHRRKTGALIVAALKLGALSARASEAQLNVLERYGQELGQAFQISDDLLDVLGSEDSIGKRVHKDEEAGKLTYVSLYGIDETKCLLAQRVLNAKNALLESRLFDVDSPAFHAAIYLADFVARRDR